MGCVNPSEKIKLNNINNTNNYQNNFEDDLNNNSKTKSNNNGEESYNSNLKTNNSKLKKFSTKFESKYFIVCELNQSENYNLYKIGLKSEENKYFSMKIIKKSSESDKNEEQKIKNEINILKSLKHPNIIKVHDCLISTNNYKLITEFVSNLNLLDLINVKKIFKEKTVKSIIFQILSAIKYLNQNNFVHTDIKPSNIIVKINKNDENDDNNNNSNISANEDEVEYLVKLVDFGSSNNNIANCHINNVKKITIPLPYYLSPEIINKKYNSKCDVWSTGIIMYQMLFGYVPFDGKDKEEVINNILNKDINFNINDNNNNNQNIIISDECLNLLKHMLDKDINYRYDSEQCINDDYFKNYVCFNGKSKNKNNVKIKIGKNNDNKNFTTYLYNLDHINDNNNNYINKSYDFIYPIYSNNNESESNFTKITLKYIQHYLHINYYIDKENVIINNLFNKINKNNNNIFENNYMNILNCFLIYSNIYNNSKYNFFNFDEFLEKKFKIDFYLFENKKEKISFENLKDFLIKEKSVLINDLLFTAYDDLCYYNKKYFEKVFKDEKNINPKFKIYFKNIINLMKKNKLKDNYLFNDFRIIVINAIDEIENKILHSHNYYFNNNNNNNNDNKNNYINFFDNEINNKKNFQINNFII